MSTPLQDNLMEADEQTEQRGKVWRTLRHLAATLDRLGVPYAVVGGIALQHHGVPRSTQDVDVLLSGSSLDAVHQALIGHGFDRKAPQSRHLRDEVTRVRIEFLITGDYPGDGKPKPVAFPDPASVAERSDEGLSFANLKTLIELKLASAKSAPHRIRDRADVLELIHLRSLGADFAEQLDPYVQQEFRELTALPSPNERD